MHLLGNDYVNTQQLDALKVECYLKVFLFEMLNRKQAV